ncbi:MAG: hypothetical protein P8010_02880 [Desulfosarcinaceae bacterium]|jgi:hypothetical protein
MTLGLFLVKDITHWPTFLVVCLAAFRTGCQVRGNVEIRGLIQYRHRQFPASFNAIIQIVSNGDPLVRPVIGVSSGAEWRRFDEGSLW